MLDLIEIIVIGNYQRVNVEILIIRPKFNGIGRLVKIKSDMNRFRFKNLFYLISRLNILDADRNLTLADKFSNFIILARVVKF